MSRVLRIILIIVGAIFALFAVMIILSTLGMKEIKEYSLGAFDLNAIPNGKYQGSCAIGRWSFTLLVTVNDHKITEIETLKGMARTTSKPEMYTVINQKVIETQSLEIDAVSGASINTKAYLIAVADALAAAGR